MAEQEVITTLQLKRQANRAVLDLIQRIAEKKETGTHQLAQCKALGKLAPLVEALRVK